MIFFLYAFIYPFLICVGWFFLRGRVAAHGLFHYLRISLLALPLLIFIPSFDFPTSKISQIADTEDFVTPTFRTPNKDHPSLIFSTMEEIMEPKLLSREVKPTTISMFIYVWGIYAIILSILLMKLVFALNRMRQLEASSHCAFEFKGIPVYTHKSNLSPMSYGVFSPRIFIPQILTKSLDDEGLALVLEHENVHIKRRDIQLNAYMQVLKCVLWFSPFLIFLAKQLNKSMEISCDRQVCLGKTIRKKYAATLLNCQLLLQGSLNPLTVGHQLGKSELRSRIEAFKDTRPNNRSLLLASLCLLFLAVACVNPSHKSEESWHSPNQAEGIAYWSDEVFDEFFSRN